MLIRAWVVHDLGIVPNCRPSTIFNMAGLTNLSTTTSSATFDRTGVSDIGLKCKLISKTGFCFDKGVTFAIFQDAGKPRSRNDPFNMSFTGLDKTSAFSLNIQVGRPSGPGAFEGFRCSNCRNTEFSVHTSSKADTSICGRSSCREGKVVKEAMGDKKA